MIVRKSGARIAAFTAAAVLVLGLGACTSNDDAPEAPTTSAAAASPAPTTSRDTDPYLANLTNFPRHTISGPAPAKWPSWKLGGDAATYTHETLRLLGEAARQMGLPTTGFRYVIYAYNDPKLKVLCHHVGEESRPAADYSFARWCPAIDAMLVVPPSMNNPRQWNKSWSTDAAIYWFISAFADTLAKHEESDASGCNAGLLYRGLVKLMPDRFAELAEMVNAFYWGGGEWDDATLAFMRGDCEANP